MIYTVLHPHHKLSYFKTAGWETKWIDTAEAIVHAKFECSYTASDGDKSVDDELIEVQAEKRVSWISFW